jgi:hypothetical protein
MGCVTPFSVLPVPALLRVVCNQVVNQQLNRIECFWAAPVQLEREDSANDLVAFGPGGVPRLLAQGDDALGVVLVELWNRNGRLAHL